MRLLFGLECFIRRWRRKQVICGTFLCLIVCSYGVRGQDTATVALSHPQSSPSEVALSDVLQNSHSDGMMLPLRTEDIFAVNLDKGFYKHRWKLSSKEFAMSPVGVGGMGAATSRPLVTVPTSISGNVTPSTMQQLEGHYRSDRNNNNYEDEHNVGQEEIDEDEPDFLNLMKEANVEDIPRVPSHKQQNENKIFGNHTLVDDHDLKTMELIHSDIFKVPKEGGLISSTAISKKHLQSTVQKDEDAQNEVLVIELLKIDKTNNSAGNSNSSDSFVKLNSNEGDENRTFKIEDEVLIPQLVNVTTENVYVSMEDGDEDTPGNKLGFQDFASTAGEPAVITVNASGIFPQTNLSSIWDRHTKGHRAGSSLVDTNDLSEHRTKKEGSERGVEGSESDSNSEDSSGESMDEDKQEKTMMMKRRPRRSVVHLYDMVVCATGCNPLIYKGYGCFCGFMGSGITVDGIDKCCYKHDWCYHHAKCPPLLTYFVPYYWTCNGGYPKCVSDFRGWQGICGAHLCECDRQFAECLKKYPCPRTRAMCMTSPWRFWQNVVMPPPYYG